MDDLQILVKAVIDESSASALDSQLSKLAKTLGDSHNLKIKVVLDEGSVSTVQTQLQAIAKQVQSAGASGGAAPLKIFDTTQLQKDGQMYFLSVQDIVSRAQQQFSSLGKVDITNVFKNAKGEIQSFSANVTKADGVIERFNFNLSQIKSGEQVFKGFVQSSSVLADKNAGTNLEQTLNYLNRIDTKIADITSKTLTNTSKPLLGDMEQYTQYQTKLNEVKARIEEIKSSNSTLSAEHKREIDSMVADLQRYAKELQASAYAATDLKANTFANQQSQLQAQLETSIKKWQNAGIFGGEFKRSVEEAKATLDSALNPNDLDTYRHKLALIEQQFKQIKLDNAHQNSLLGAERLNTNIQATQLRIQNLKQTYSSFVSDPSLNQKWQQLFDESQIVSSDKELTNLNAKVRLFEQELIKAGKHSASLWDQLKNNMVKMGSWMILGGVISGIMRGVNGLYDAVVELDTAMVELKKVTNETDQAYDDFLSTAADKAVEIGTSYSDFVNSTADFARLGYSMEDATNLSEVANIYAVVGDEISGVDQATTSIISTMKAFGIEASNAMSIVDKFNEVGNNFAISSGGIGDAMQRSAAALAAANNTIDESIALIVAANNVIQDPDMVGTMWKTVSMRIRGATTELEEAGLETEYMANSTADLQKKVKALTNVKGLGGFDIMADSKNFKSTYDIILGISKVWKDMSDIDQAALLELLAGKRQGNALAAALTNMQDAEKVLRTSSEAEGSAMAEHEKWMDSVEAKQQQFQAQYQKFANAILSSELIKGTFDAGTGLLGWLTKLVETVGAFPTILATLTPFFDKMQLLKSTTSKNWLGTGTGIDFAWNTGKIDLDNDIRLLDEYNNKILNLGDATDNMTQRQIIWNDTIGRGSDSLKTAVHVTDSAAVSTDTYKASMQGASASTTAMGVASKAAAVGIGVLRTAMNMLINLGIGLAINAIISGISSLINKQKEARQAAKEAAEAAAESSNELYDLVSAYIELGNAIDNGTGSREDYISLQDQIITALGLEGKSVRELAGDYDTLREGIVAAAKSKLETNIATAAEGARAAKEDAADEIETFFGDNTFYSPTGDGAVEALEYLEKLGFSGISVGTKGGTIMPPNSMTWDVTDPVEFDEVVENYRYLQDAVTAVSKEFGADNPVTIELAGALRTYESALEDAFDEINSTNELVAQNILLSVDNDEIPNSLEGFIQFRKNLISELENDVNYDASGNKTAENYIDSVLAQNEQYSVFLDELNEREQKEVEINNKMNSIVEALIPKTYEGLEEGTSAHFHAIDEWGTKAEELRQKLRGLSEEKFDVAYDAIQHGATTWEEIATAIEEYNSEQEIASRKSEKLKSSLNALWNSDGFKDAKEELIGLAQTVNGITPENITDLADESSQLAEVLDEDGMNAQFLAHILQTEALGGDGFSLITEDALKLNEALEGLKGQFSEITDAKSRYDAAMSVDEKDTNFRSYAEAFEELNEQFVAGTTNSNAFWAAAEFLFGTEQLNTWGWSEGLDQIYEAMQKNVGIFEDADSAGAGFLDRLYALSEAGEVKADDGTIIAEIQKLADGSYDFQFDTDDLDKLADKMGITEEAAMACMQALSMYGDFQFYDIQTVMDTIKEIGFASDSINGTAVNVGTLTDQLISLGYTNKDIYDLYKVLSEVDGVTLLNVDANVETLTQNLTDLGLAAQDGIEVKVNADGLADLMSQLNFTKEDTQNLITKLGEADGITLTNANGEVVTLNDALEYTDTLSFASVTSELDAITDSADLAEDAVAGLQRSINTLKGKTVTVEVDIKRKNSILGSIGSFLGFAKGTKDAPEGEALVGEEGEELVKSGDKAYLAGTNGPEIVNLEKGDTVYTAEQTKKIKQDAKIVRGTMPAYAGGKLNTGGGRPSVTGDGGSGSGSGSGNGSSSSSSNGAPWDEELKNYQHLRKMELITDQEYYDKLNELLDRYASQRSAYLDDYNSLMEETFDLARELADDWFNDKEHDLFLMDKNDASAEDQVAVYREMQEKAHSLAEQARAYGLDENSDYIQGLQKQWWDYEDEIEDLLHSIYEDTVSNHDKAIKYLESQYDALSSNRAMDQMSENLQAQLSYQEAIQRAAVEEMNRLRAAGYQETDEEMQDCMDTWWEAADAIRSINKQIADDILDVYDDFIEYADDFDLWNDLDFTKVDYLKRKLEEINRLWKQGVLTLEEYNDLLRETKVSIYQEQKDALDDIIERTMDLIRQEAEDHVDALEDQIDKFRDIIELKKESLRLSEDEDDYEREVAKRVKEIAEKQEKINQLDRDDSREANAEKQRLAQELAELQEELADYQADYSYNAQVDALDREADAFEDTKNAEIDRVESSVQREVDVYNAAIARINAGWDALYNDLMEWNETYGDMIDGPDSITSAWRTAMEAAMEYGDVVSALEGISSNIAYEEEQARNAQYAEDKVHTIIKEMYANGQAWGSANASEKSRLDKRNLALGAQLAQYGITAVRGSDGVWYVNRVGGEHLFDKYKKYTYHTGGIAGETPGLKNNEIAAILEKGEAVIPKSLTDSFMERFTKSVVGVVDALVGKMAEKTPAVSEAVQSVVNNNGDTDNSTTENGVQLVTHIHMTEGVTKENAKQFADYYAEGTIERLRRAGKRKGIKNNVSSSMLKW